MVLPPFDALPMPGVLKMDDAKDETMFGFKPLPPICVPALV
eukprot:CAMPEP_0114365000 /NCGR_PEP_ID=MMETSP0101-20121206/28007_1 /TAXON_ID=38822 ORGANISM="Pteridomonas danica, Strain PT" /NCGR_SAMPLE_ID=MMETSP0101 /ASSEMBLY_ACC=CAM_ASM_000211 /LENGTH=40 /DNA_ID= /DNA_START= /DNA_END= /DNA_ORIENTATION=